MDKSELTKVLSELEDFDSPDVSLEQYMTPPALASDILYAAYMQGDLKGKRIADLGTGTGIFGIGAELLGGEVKAFDKDEDALKIAEKNAEKLGVNLEVIHKDVENLEVKFDTVLMNPPFSVHSEEGLKFFRKAFELSDNVYAVGPTDSLGTIKDLAEKFGHRITETETYRIKLPPTYGFHTEEEHLISVKIYVTERESNGN